MRQRPNYLAGLGSLVWLVLIGFPLYVLLISTVRTQSDYATGGPLALPSQLTLQNYFDDFSNGFGRDFANTLIVTASVVAIVLLVVPPLAYAIVRSRSRTMTGVFRVFLLGLAIPAQAVIVPMFYVISKAGLYDNLVGIILPTAAFCLPICTLILTGAMRDITSELYEAMAVDGAAPGGCSCNSSCRCPRAGCRPSWSSPRSRPGTASSSHWS
jgi:xylobiose transport system permease protein